MTAVNRPRLQALAEAGNMMAKLVLRLINDYDRLLSTVLVGNNIVNITLTAVGTALSIRLCGAKVGATVSAVVLTILVLLLGEITPKRIAKEYPERVALLFAVPLYCCSILLVPVNYLFTLWTKMFSKVFKLPQTPKHSQQELLILVEEVQKEGSIDKDEGVLLRNAIKFTDSKAEDIITHRVDIVAVPVTATQREIADKFLETQFSRLLVYEESLDHIVGVLVLKTFYASMNKPQWSLKDIVIPPFFIQKTEKIDDVLKKLQSSRSQVAVVLDEFGGTLGILTMEDILEELVGEIWDEHDEVVEKFKQISEDSYSVDCTVTLDDFQEFFHVHLQSEESMLNGWILEQIQKLPQKGDRCSVENLEITISSCGRYRVRRVYVKVLPTANTEEGAPTPAT